MFYLVKKSSQLPGQEGGESWVRWLLVCIPSDGRLRVGEGQCQGPAGKALLAAAGSGQVPVLQCLLEAWISQKISGVDGNSVTRLCPGFGGCENF